MQEKALLTRIKLIPFAIVASIVVMGVVMWQRRMQGVGIYYNNLQTVFMIVIPALTISGIAFGNFITKTRLRLIEVDASLNRKLQVYLVIVTIRSALIEAPAMLSIIFYFYTGYVIFLVFPAILSMWIIFQNTTSERMCTELSFSRKDREDLGI